MVTRGKVIGDSGVKAQNDGTWGCGLAGIVGNRGTDAIVEACHGLCSILRRAWKHVHHEC